jgi:arylsulfatase
MTGYYAPQTGSDPNRGEGTYVSWAKPIPQMLKPLGYRTYQSGKWHAYITGCHSAHAAGFDRAYDSAQGWLLYTPFYHALDGKMLPRAKPEDGYFVDQAVGNYMVDFLNEHYAQHADQPFFAYLAFLGPHYPLKAPQEFIDKYNGVYDAGWDVIRRRRYEKMMALGFPSSWKLSAPEPDVISRHSPQTEEARKVRNEQMGFEDVYQYTPWETLSDKQKKEQAKKMEIHAAMVDIIDQQVGRVLALLKEKGQLDNTLILFLSDNGADCTQMIPNEQLQDFLKYQHDNTARWGSENTALALGPAWTTVCNTPFRRHKIWTHEGGPSTPLIARWPKGITQKPGGFVYTCGHVIDFMPTFLELAGGEIKPMLPDAPPFPGKSLVPALQGKDIARDYIYFKHDSNRALIKGKWKISSAFMDGNKWELYNIEDDRTEMHNLAAENPETLDELTRFWARLDNEYRKQGGYTK